MAKDKFVTNKEIGAATSSGLNPGPDQHISALVNGRIYDLVVCVPGNGESVQSSRNIATRLKKKMEGLGTLLTGDMGTWGRAPYGTLHGLWIGGNRAGIYKERQINE